MKKTFLYNPRWKSRKDSLPLVCRAAGLAYPEPGYQEYASGSGKDCCGVFWCVSGSALLEIEEKKELRLFAGDAVFYSVGESHRLKVDNPGFSYYWAVWSGVLAQEYLAAYGIESGVKIHLEESLKEQFQRLLNTMRHFSLSAVYEGGVILNEILSRISYAFAGAEHSNSETEEKNLPLIELFKDIISSEFHDPALNLDAIAEMLNVHRTTISRTVKKHLGVTPADYLQSIRLRSALSLLKYSNRPVKNIGFECGFSSPSYFSKVVREKTGLTPNKFRSGSVEDLLLDSNQ